MENTGAYLLFAENQNGQKIQIHWDYHWQSYKHVPYCGGKSTQEPSFYTKSVFWLKEPEDFEKLLETCRELLTGVKPDSYVFKQIVLMDV